MLLNQVPTIENTGVLLSWATKDTAKPFILESKSTAITPPDNAGHKSNIGFGFLTIFAGSINLGTLVTGPCHASVSIFSGTLCDDTAYESAVHAVFMTSPHLYSNTQRLSVIPKINPVVVTITNCILQYWMFLV